jgi:hypothetical protein
VGFLSFHTHSTADGSERALAWKRKRRVRSSGCPPSQQPFQFLELSRGLARINSEVIVTTGDNPEIIGRRQSKNRTV